MFMKRKSLLYLEQLRKEYAPNLSYRKFQWIYINWENTKWWLTFKKYLQVWLDINEVEYWDVELQINK